MAFVSALLTYHKLPLVEIVISSFFLFSFYIPPVANSTLYRAKSNPKKPIIPTNINNMVTIDDIFMGDLSFQNISLLVFGLLFDFLPFLFVPTLLSMYCLSLLVGHSSFSRLHRVSSLLLHGYRRYP